MWHSVKQAFYNGLPRKLELPMRYLSSYARGHLERELRIARRHVKPGDVVVDVGANVGLYAYSFANRGAFVHAFEPVTSCRKVLEAYSHPRIKTYPIALSDKQGKMTMRIPVWNGRPASALATLLDAPSSNSSETLQEVEVRTLDSYALPLVHFLKIDVEGHEPRVLEGSSQTIAKFKPTLLIEIEQRHLHLEHGSIYDVFKRVESWGYQGSFFEGNKRLPIDQFDLARHQLAEIPTIERRGFSATYVNNFMFLPI